QREARSPRRRPLASSPDIAHGALSQRDAIRDRSLGRCLLTRDPRAENPDLVLRIMTILSYSGIADGGKRGGRLASSLRGFTPSRSARPPPAPFRPAPPPGPAGRVGCGYGVVIPAIRVLKIHDVRTRPALGRRKAAEGRSDRGLLTMAPGPFG